MPHRALGDANIAVAGTAQVQVVGASPFSYVNSGPNTEVLYFTVPTGVTASVARGGVTLASILTPAATTIPITILAPPGSTTVFTYSAGAPVLVRDAI
jgi:hypothetical protein